MADLIICEREDLVDIANTIRSHTGKTDGITLGNMPSEINEAIKSKEPELQEKTISPSTSSQTVTPDTGYDGLSQVIVDAMPVVEQASPIITVSNSGLINVSLSQHEGYVLGGDKKAQKQLRTQEEQTIIPNTSDIIIRPDTYLIGMQTIKGDPNLSEKNIKKDIQIFGITGVYEGEGGSSDSNDIAGIIDRSVTNITLPSSLINIGTYAFYNCYNLALTELPSSLTNIDSYAFYSCKNLALTELPPSLTSIGNYVFYGCNKLALTELPSEITSIGNSAFYGCNDLVLTELPSSLTNMSNSAFANCMNLKTMKIKCQQLGTGTKIFQKCSKLTKVWISSNCTTITVSSSASSHFAGCPDTLEIYTDATEKLSGWDTYFNKTGTSGSVEATVHYGVSEAEFDAIINPYITFTIDSISYTAERNTAWSSWIGTDYNTLGTDNMTLGENNELCFNNKYLKYENNYVHFTDIIIDKANYILSNN